MPLTDFPDPEELTDPLREEVDRLVTETGGGKDDVITRVAGCKFGGWPNWDLTGPDEELNCRDCDAPLYLLFSVASDHTTRITIGRWGDLRVFVCSVDIRHGYEFDVG
ncbi:hypothetical protein ACHZ98_32975 [Streptomyces sp. MAR4 CNY-716]